MGGPWGSGGQFEQYRVIKRRTEIVEFIFFFCGGGGGGGVLVKEKQQEQVNNHVHFSLQTF